MLNPYDLLQRAQRAVSGSMIDSRSLHAYAKEQEGDSVMPSAAGIFRRAEINHTQEVSQSASATLAAPDMARTSAHNLSFLASHANHQSQCSLHMSGDVTSTLTQSLPAASSLSAATLFDFSRRSSATPSVPLHMKAAMLPMKRAISSVIEKEQVPSVPLSAACSINKESSPSPSQGAAALPPLVTLVKGRFFVPAARSKRASPSSSAIRAAMDNCAYSLARESLLIPPGINKSRARAGIIPPNEEPRDPPTSSAEQRKRACENEVERTLSIFTLDMSQALLPFSPSELAQMKSAEKEDASAARLRIFLIDKAERHLSSLSNARRALLRLYRTD